MKWWQARGRPVAPVPPAPTPELSWPRDERASGNAGDEGPAARRLEVGRLRRGDPPPPRPGAERLTPRNKDELLFDDVLGKAGAAGARRLRRRSPTAVSRCSICTSCWARRSTSRRGATRPSAHHPSGRPRAEPGPCGRRVASCPPRPELAERLIGGIAYDELPFESRSLAAQAPTVDGGFVLPPLPNHLFTRDTSAWVFDGVTVHEMASPRAGARRCTSTIYRYHPLFANEPHETWSDRLGGPAQLEGGDVLVVGNGCLLIGMGERTRPAESSSRRSGCSTPARRSESSPCPCRRSGRACTSTRS